MFSELPHEYVPPEMLRKVAEHGGKCEFQKVMTSPNGFYLRNSVHLNYFVHLASNKLYACAVSRADHLIHKDGAPFDADEYDEHPQRYYSTFSKKVFLCLDPQ